jgi:hypothetical protein
VDTKDNLFSQLIPTKLPVYLGNFFYFKENHCVI